MSSQPERGPSAGAVEVVPGPGTPIDPDRIAPDDLVELAREYGVATEFWDWRGQPVDVLAGTVMRVLAALDVRVRTDGDVAAELVRARQRPWRQTLPEITVLREGAAATIDVHAGEDDDLPTVVVDLEDGDGTPLELERIEDEGSGSTDLDGRRVVRLRFAVPDDLPLGWHTVRTGPGDSDVRRPLVVTPRRMPLPPALERQRSWGFMTQLYSVRSAASWGLGDLADLDELVSWSGHELGADFVLVNPLHAAEPVPPMEPSPYLPTTRRFANPVYLRVEDVREVAYLPATERAIVEWQAEAMRALDDDPGELDRDAVWAAKRSVLETIFLAPRSRARQAAFEAFVTREGQGLEDFATWCALVEQYGLPTSRWPQFARDPHGDAVAQLRVEHATRVRFHLWLQWCLDEQLARVARTAADAGMAVGVIHDLAVGVHPDGADAWSLGDVLARGVTGGAPPDMYNQQGQDWSQPPWRPDKLRETGYAAFRDMLRTVLRHAGGLRVDHIIGLFRMWWVPAGAGPADGTYVRYDHEAMIGILALEAQRAGAFVVGEDLGNVEPWARDFLRERGMFGTSILWFEKDGSGQPLDPAQWRELCLATVTTHDLPPTAGYLAGEHIELRQRLGLLTRPVSEVAAIDAEEQAAVLQQLTDLGLLGDSPTERDKVEALHAFLTRTPARLLGVALADAVGDRRAQNQPGTTNEYPNWRLPLADGVGRPVPLEELIISARVTSLARVVSENL